METNKEITLNDLASLIQGLDTKIDLTTKTLEEKIEATAKTLGAKIDSSTEELATMTQKQFLKLEQKVDATQKDVAKIDTTVNNIQANLIKKVDKIEYNTLDYRVEKLEEKFA
jgi:predicted  nucleic acid-binding Zn-ribbon protein